MCPESKTFLVALAALAALSGCDNQYGSGLACAPDAAVACTCDDGRAGFAICSARGAFGACECRGGPTFDIDDEIPEDNPPFTLRVEPEDLFFGALPVGQQRVETLTISNEGPGTARIDLSIDEDDPQREFTWVGAEGDRPFILGPGELRTARVVYAPVDEVPDTGSVQVGAHDGTAHRVGLDARAPIPDIDGPQEVALGDVPTGSAVRRSVFLRNVGAGALLIDSLVLDGSEEFTFCLSDASGEWSCPGQFSEGMTLEAGKVLQLQVVYRPAADGRDFAVLHVLSNDPDESDFQISLSAEGAAPCIESNTDAINFGEVPISGLARRTVTLTNCSPLRPLVVRTIRAVGDVAFSVSDLPEPLPEAGLRLDAGQSTTFSVVYRPRSEARHLGAVEVFSNNTDRSPLTIDLSGVGIPFDNCPVAVAGARVEDSGEPFGDLLEALPLAMVEFSPEGSFDPDNPDDPDGISRVEWTIIERPTDSNARLTPDGAAQTPSLFLDLSGRYVIELRVFDQGGTASCEPARVTILAISNEDIHVQLVWDTSSDPDENDGFGTDLDLHLLHPSGSWSEPEWDCHWISPNPRWGQPTTSDDPSLDIDDTDGSGPENINLDNPESVRYKVGVHYYGDNGFGRSAATVRVFLSGVLVFEALDQPMGNRQFWEAALIDWQNVEVTDLGEVFDDIP